MKGFYSPIDQLAAQLPRTKGTGAEFMTELSKRPGYKPQEAQDRELQTLMALPKMERAQFLEALKAKPPVTPLARDTQQNYHEDYTLPGGTNYREILLQHPRSPERFPGVSQHFGGAPNILASVRAKDRMMPGKEGYTLVNKKSFNKSQHFDTAEEAQAALQNMPESLRPSLDIRPSVGPKRKVLHIEEIQSDWHQKGRDKGYLPSDMPKQIAAAKLAHRRLKQQLEEARGYSEGIDKKLSSDKPLYQDPEVRQRMEAVKIEHNNNIMGLMPQVMKAEAAYQDLEHKAKTGVPDAPFKKNWHELALKKMIHHAAANGYDSIAITPGAEQAKRYGLSRQLSGISYRPDEQDFYAFDPQGDIAIREHGASPERISQLVGKELTKKLLETPKQDGFHNIKGQDLEVGGEGMKGFYDKMVPAFLNQFGKKYGAQVQPGSVSIVSTPAQHHGLTESQFQAQSPEEQQRMVRQHAYAHQGAKTEVPVHHFPITPQMREDVTQNGVPLYADGGGVEDIQNTARQNDAYPDIEKYLQTRDAVPDVQMSSNLPEGTNGMFSSINLPIGSGQLKINKNSPKQILPSVLTHEMTHAADRQMMQQAMEQGMFGKSNQFTEAYQKLVGPEGINRTDLARKINPDWASDNQYYRALPQEIAAHGVGAFSGPNTQDRAPKHVDATAATEFQILLDLAQRNANKGPQGLAKIPAFFSKIGKYADGGKVKPIGYTKEKVTVSPNLDAMRYELMSVKHYAKKVK